LFVKSENTQDVRVDRGKGQKGETGYPLEIHDGVSSGSFSEDPPPAALFDRPLQTRESNFWLRSSQLFEPGVTCQVRLWLGFSSQKGICWLVRTTRRG